MQIITNDLSKKHISENLCIIADFDGTITTVDSFSSIGIFRRILGNKYNQILNKEMERLRREDNLSDFDKTLQFAIFELKLLSNYLKKGIDINEYICNFQLRRDFIDLVTMLNKEGKKLYINSSGIGNVIEQVFRKNDLYSDNMYITSNFYGDDFCFDYSNVIFSRRKYNSQFLEQVKGFDSKILVGNSITDINMLPHNERNNKNIYIGICENPKKTIDFMKYFDIISLDSCIYTPVKKALSIKK